MTALNRARGGQRALEDLAEHPPIAGTEGCPDPHDFARLAGDGASEEERARLLEHAADCVRCAVVLSTLYGADDEEELDVNDASTVQPSGDVASLARAMALAYGASDARSSVGPRWLSWAAAAAILALALAVGAVFVSLRDRTSAVDGMLRDAYSERRTIELRYPGAAFAPLAVTRGGDVDDTATAGLLDARTVILRALSSNPGSEEWLHAKSRADLLLWRYAEAIETLEQLAIADPDSPALLVDLATGLFERAEIQQRASDYVEALALLDRALEGDAENLTALYNRAILLEKLSRFTQAVEAWDAYLALDASSSWAQEAVERRRTVRQRPESVGSTPRRAVIRNARSTSVAPKAQASGSTGWA